METTEEENIKNAFEKGKEEVIIKFKTLIRNMGRSNLIPKTKIEEIIKSYEEDEKIKNEEKKESDEESED